MLTPSQDLECAPSSKRSNSGLKVQYRRVPSAAAQSFERLARPLEGQSRWDIVLEKSASTAPQTPQDASHDLAKPLPRSFRLLKSSRKASGKGSSTNLPLLGDSRISRKATHPKSLAVAASTSKRRPKLDPRDSALHAFRSFETLQRRTSDTAEAAEDRIATDSRDDDANKAHRAFKRPTASPAEAAWRKESWAASRQRPARPGAPQSEDEDALLRLAEELDAFAVRECSPLNRPSAADAVGATRTAAAATSTPQKALKHAPKPSPPRYHERHLVPAPSVALSQDQGARSSQIKTDMDLDPGPQDPNDDWVYDLFVCEPVGDRDGGDRRGSPAVPTDQSGQRLGVLVLSEEEEQLWAEEGELTDSEGFLTDDEDENGTLPRHETAWSPLRRLLTPISSGRLLHQRLPGGRGRFQRS